MKLIIGLYTNKYENVLPANAITALKKYIEGNNVFINL